jgi:lysophospholipase L1-like esterase
MSCARVTRFVIALAAFGCARSVGPSGGDAGGRAGADAAAAVADATSSDGAAGGGAGGQRDGAAAGAGGGDGGGGSLGDAPVVEASVDATVDASDVRDADASEAREAGALAWTGTWAASPQSCGGTLAGRTIRAIVHTSLGGDRARVRFSNAFGGGPLQIRDVHLAQRAAGASIDPATDVALTFKGQASLSIAPGMYDVSDGAAFVVKPLSDVAVSFFVVSHAGTTCHQSGFQTNYQATGDVAGDKTLAGTTNGSYPFVSGLDVESASAEGAVVTLGASITDGYSSRGDANRRWPNDLAARLVAASRAVGVLNQGISGDGVANAVKRFERDVLSQPNVRWVIFSDNPINDLGNFNPPPQTEVDQMKAMIAAAHARGVKFLCSTLTPFQGAKDWSAQKETGRAAIDTFIRSPDSGCDGVVDQDAATHDPANPTAFLPSYDSGDHLHPNEAGLQAIANAVDLALLK